MADRITFTNKINESVQVGDKLYVTNVSINPPLPPVFIGDILDIGEKYVDVDTAPSMTGGATLANTFYMFKKVNISTTNADNVTVNSYSKSGTKGYYASVKMSTSEPTKTKLFALGSEVAVSSK